MWSTWVDFGFFGVVPHFIHFRPNFFTTAALKFFHSDDCKKLLPLSFNLCAISLSFFPYLIVLFGECLSKAKPYRIKMKFRPALDDVLFGAMSSHRIGQTSEIFIPTTRLYPSPTAPALVRSCNRVSQMQPPTAPHCIATKRKKPHKSLCGLGSWREQQRTIESTQKYASCLTRPHRNLWGSQVDSFV